MGNHLPPATREDLARVAAGIRAAGPALNAERQAALYLADSIREALPDISEVEIGRVALHLSSSVAVMGETGYAPARIGNVLALAAIDLTASALDSPDVKASRPWWKRWLP